MGRAATIRARKGQSQSRGRTRPDSDQPATRWDNRPPQPEATADNLLAQWMRKRGHRTPVTPQVRAERAERRRQVRAERAAARQRARANGKRRGRD